MPVKASIKPAAVITAVPTKTGNGKSIQPKKKNGLFTTGTAQRKEHSGSWIHQQPQRSAGAPSQVQPKAHLHSSNDHFEKEADAIADQAVSKSSTAIPHTFSKVSTAGAQRKCAHCEKEEKEVQACSVQRKCAACEEKEQVQAKRSYILQNKESSADSSPPAYAASENNHPLDHVLSNQNTRGSPLPAHTQSHMEDRIGADFSNVRIHTDQSSHAASTSIGARAFTNGSNIHFAQGEFNPQSQQGQHLLAHELVHTVQQGAATAGKKTNANPLSSDGSNHVFSGHDNAGGDAAMAANTTHFNNKSAIARDKTGNLVVGPNSPPHANKTKPARPAQVRQKLDKKVAQPDSKFKEAAAPSTEEKAQFKQKIKTKKAPTLSRELLKQPKGKKLNKDPVALPKTTAQKPKKEIPKAAAQSSYLKNALQSASALNQLSSGGIQYKADEDKQAANQPARKAEQQQSSFHANGVMRKAAVAAASMLQGLMQVRSSTTLKANAEKARISQNEQAQKQLIASSFKKERAAIKKAAGQASGSINGYHVKVTNELKAASTKGKADILAAKNTNTDAIEAAAAAQIPKIDQTYTDAKPDFIASGVSIGNQCYAQQNQRSLGEFLSKMKHEDDSLLDGPYTDDIKQAKGDAAAKVGDGYKEGISKAGAEQAGKIDGGKQNDYKKVTDSKTEMLKGLVQSYDTALKAIEAAETAGITQADSTKKSMLSSVYTQLKTANTQLDASEKMQTQTVEILAASQSHQIDLQATQAGEAMEKAGAENITRFHDSFKEFKSVTAQMNSPPAALLKKTLTPIEASIESGVKAMSTSLQQGIQQVGTGINKTATETISTTNTTEAAALADTALINGKAIDGLKKLQSAAVTALQGVLNNNKKTIVETASQCVTDIQNIKTSFDGALSKLGTDLASGLKAGAAELKTGLKNNVDNGDAQNKSMLETSIKNEEEAASKVEPRWKSALKILLVIVVILVIALVVGPAVIGFIGAAAGGGAFGTAVGAVVGGAILGAASSGVITIGNNLIDGKTWHEGVGHAMLEGAITGAIGGAFGAAGGALGGQIFGAAAKGIGPALGKFAIQQAFDFAGNVVVEFVGAKMNGQPFSWESVAKGQAMGAGMHIGMEGLGAMKNVKGFKTVNNVMEGSAKFGEHLGGSARAQFTAPKTEINAPTAKPTVEEPLKAPASKEEPVSNTSPKEEPSANTTPKEEPVKTAPKEETAAPIAKEEPVKSSPNEEVKTAPKEETKTTPQEEVKTAPKEELKAPAKEETKVAPKEEVKANPLEDPLVKSKEETKTAVAKEEGVAPHTEEGTTPGGKKQSELPSNLSKEEVELGVVAKSPTEDGHNIKVTEKGEITICSNCAKLETKYSNELQDPKIKQEFEDIKAMTDPEAKAKAARNFDRMMEARLMAEYRGQNPNSKMTDADIKAKIREGSRMNEDTGLFNKPEGPEAKVDKPAAFEKEPLKPGETEAKTKVDEYDPNDFHEDVKAKNDDLIKQREKEQALRNDHPEGSDPYKEHQAKVVKASEALGNNASEGIAKQKGFDGEPLNTGPEFRDGKGTFDRIFEKDGKMLVAESKGGNSPLGSKEVTINGETMRVQQGTKEYFEATCQEMMSPNRSPEEQALGAKLLSKSQKGEVTYVLVQQPVNVKNELGVVKVKTFKP
jgi:hypothetical protein